MDEVLKGGKQSPVRTLPCLLLRSSAVVRLDGERPVIFQGPGDILQGLVCGCNNNDMVEFKYCLICEKTAGNQV